MYKSKLETNLSSKAILKMVHLDEELGSFRYTLSIANRLVCPLTAPIN